MKELCLEGVTRWFRSEKLVLNRINLTVEKPEAVLIIGSAGSGKTALFQIISKQTVPDEGIVKINGRMALVCEELPFMSGLCVEDYIFLPLMLLGNKKKAIRPEVGYAMKRSGLWAKKDMKTETLSAYDKCRLMLAMAMIQDPDIIVMEQCQKHLTKEDGAQFWQFARTWIKEKKVALICFSDKDIEAGLFNTRYLLSNGNLEELNTNEKNSFMCGSYHFSSSPSPE